jgi:phage terminase large subunit GpA-like protein
VRLSDTSDIRASRLTALRPPSSQTVSEWADANRVLDSSASSEPGPWRTDRVPYLREVMDVLSPSHPAQSVVLKKCARIGGTEAINNMIGTYMALAPCPIMVVQPSESDAEEWSKDALDPMLESTPSLAGLVTTDRQKAKGNTILHKRYLGGVIYAVSASTAKSFRRRLARVLAMDELDAYPESLAGEGAPEKLAEKRTETYPWSKKIVRCSTPTVRGASRIEAAYEASDQRRYLVPCPECRHMQPLEWAQLRWPDGDPAAAEYVCAECGTCIPHHRKPWMLDEANGAHWAATNPGAATIGFHLGPALYSSMVPWSQLAREWIDSRGDPTLEQVFANTVLGETWDAKNAEKWDDESLRALLEPIAELPSRVACITAGADAQGDRLVFQADAWGPHEERWTLERRDLMGDPSAPEVWAELFAAYRTRYPVEGGVIGIKAMSVDTGGQHTQAAWSFCRRYQSKGVWGVKGGSKGPGQRIWPRESRFRNKGGYSPIMLGVHDAKSVLHARLRRSAENAQSGKRGGAGFWHFSDTLHAGYFDELTSEVCVVEYSRAGRGAPKGDRKSRWVLRSPGLRNEALDISVYSYATLCGLLATGAVKLDRPMRPSPASSAKKPTAPTAPINPNPTASVELDTGSVMPTRIQVAPHKGPVPRSPAQPLRRQRHPIAPRYVPPR